MTALQNVQCEILKQYLIGTIYGPEFLCGVESVQINMPVYSHFLGKRKYLGDSADGLVEGRLFINYCNRLHEISIMSHFTYQRMFERLVFSYKFQLLET